MLWTSEEHFLNFIRVILSFLKRERRESFPLFVSKDYCFPTRTPLGVQRSLTFKWTYHVCPMNVPEPPRAFSTFLPETVFATNLRKFRGQLESIEC